MVTIGGHFIPAMHDGLSLSGQIHKKHKRVEEQIIFHFLPSLFKIHSFQATNFLHSFFFFYFCVKTVLLLFTHFCLGLFSHFLLSNQDFSHFTFFNHLSLTKNGFNIHVSLLLRGGGWLVGAHGRGHFPFLCVLFISSMKVKTALLYTCMLVERYGIVEQVTNNAINTWLD